MTLGWKAFQLIFYCPFPTDETKYKDKARALKNLSQAHLSGCWGEEKGKVSCTWGPLFCKKAYRLVWLKLLHNHALNDVIVKIEKEREIKEENQKNKNEARREGPQVPWMNLLHLSSFDVLTTPEVTKAPHCASQAAARHLTLSTFYDFL